MLLIQAISTGVRPNRTGIIAIDDEIGLAAMDHDFHYGSLVPSVLLRCNIPDDMSGSFYCGDEEDGFGQIAVTLRDAIFDGSKIFDHQAQLLDTMKRMEVAPPVLVFQSDGGADRSIKRAQTKLSLVALFKKLDLDQLVVLRCAPNGSAYDKIERAMSPFNAALSHTATKRAPMPDWAERDIKNCTSMSDVREKAEKLRDVQAAARSRVMELQQLEADRATRLALEDSFNSLIVSFQYTAVMGDANNHYEFAWGKGRGFE